MLSFRQFVELYDTGDEVEVTDRTHSRHQHSGVVIKHHKGNHRIVKFTDDFEGPVHMDSLKLKDKKKP